jgi:hypothetical protein
MTMSLPLSINWKIDQERFDKFDHFGFRFCNLDDQQKVQEKSKISDMELVVEQDETACWRLVHLEREDKVYAIFVAQMKP